MMINVEERKHELNRQGWKAEGKIYSLQQILLVKEARRTQPSEKTGSMGRSHTCCSKRYLFIFIIIRSYTVVIASVNDVRKNIMRAIKYIYMHHYLTLNIDIETQ